MRSDVHKPSWITRFRRAIHQITRHTAAAGLLRESVLLQLQALPRYSDPRRLIAHEHKAFSQNGEDGAIAEIFRRIGAQSRTFVEIGVGDGLENNTTFLLQQGWSGIWVEGGRDNCRNIRRRFEKYLTTGQLVLVEAMVTRENVARLLEPLLATRPLDLLSIDVDRNTYHVWQALSGIEPRVAVIEYNATFPHHVHWIVDYDPDKWWRGSSHFGASLASLAELAQSRQMSLVGCDLTGTNAFFVSTTLCGDRFLAPFTAENHYEPCRMHLHRTVHGHVPAIGD
ncbi:hypothetical protein HIV01_009785 [Lysobacter arenosi]|uniref:FkbM family methyltransferase n=1 Tax=Lysobacter arenosi TaxID=2795387 RepID=A0ABX7R821_9GAMM|nr:hypothetical protein [Lysobacter arenosi]QSX73547.1 hypothetical protein HIV01_009785 [Lysobacter arenosi]